MHYQDIEEVLKELKTREEGFTEVEAAERLKEYGLNEIQEAKKVSPIKIFLKQFDSFVIWILIVATIISLFLKEYADAIVILVILVLIGVLGFIQEYRAETAIKALKKLASLKAIVIRNGRKKEIDSKLIVPGDIIFLETGDKVPADARLINIVNFSTQEAALTGESHPVKKGITKLDKNIGLTDRKNMVFSGTIVVNGRATAVVIATGMKAEIGKIARLIEGVKQEHTPLQKNMDHLGRVLGTITIIIALIVLTVGLTRGPSFLKMLLVAVSLAVAAIPEGLPAVVTIALAIGTKRMLNRNVLIRRLPGVETLGSTTVICTDKTGTLTENEMTVKKILVSGKVIEITGSGYESKGQFLYKGKPVKTEDVELLLRIGLLNNNAELSKNSENGTFTLIGDPTEGALIVSAGKATLSKKELKNEYKLIDEIEFTSETKMMTTIYEHHGEKISYVKGAPEVVLSKCNYIHINGKVEKLTEEDRNEILKANKEFAQGALRVIGFAYKTLVDTQPERNLIFVGLQGMMDPPRQEVKDSIEKCKKAGIKVIMITGDQEITAKAIAKEIGLEGKSITGKELDQIANLESIVEEIVIFARVNPEHKIKIVDALKKKGHVVAMTGDGVNDAPALKRSDIGIAMGITGTDVSKEASEMILLDDNFSSIVNAVEEGRGTYDNIRKYFSFLISGNIGEVLIIFLGILFGLPLPLTATQILLINLVTDGLPALALSADPFEPNGMSRKPRKQSTPIYKGLNEFIIYYPIAMTIVALSVFVWIYDFNQNNLLKAQTATFLTISMFELYQAFACRSIIYPSLKVGLFKNKYLNIAVLSSFIIITFSVFIPAFGKYLDMVPIGFFEFVFIIVLSSIGAIIIETTKYLKKEDLGIVN